MNTRPLIVAHRGFSAQYLENTMPAIRAALKLGVDFVEIDVHETSDGQLVVYHDYRLHRICRVRGRVRRKTLAELKTLNPDIPSLSEALRACRGQARVLVEIKRADPRKVAALIEELGMEQDVIVFSLSTRRLRELAVANPRIPRFGLIARNLRSTLHASLSAEGLAKAERSKLPVSGLGLSRRLVTSRRVVEAIHRRGWKLFVWTVNRPAEMRRLADWGVDGLITDHPDRAREL